MAQTVCSNIESNNPFHLILDVAFGTCSYWAIYAKKNIRDELLAHRAGSPFTFPSRPCFGKGRLVWARAGGMTLTFGSLSLSAHTKQGEGEEK